MAKPPRTMMSSVMSNAAIFLTLFDGICEGNLRHNSSAPEHVGREPPLPA